jgi:3-phosphoshikimate 1-carboxyvinyltransferase
MGKGHYQCRGDITSQYISGLMMALPLVGGGEIEIIGKLESEPYVDLTVDVMRQFGVTVRKEGNTYYVSEGPYQPNTLTVEGDYSQAAFWLVAGAVSGEITLTGLRKDSLQGDRKIIELLREFGADIQWQGNTVRAVKSSLKGLCIDVADIPDLVPVLAVAASQAEGETRIVNGARLRLKESDRLTSTCEMIRALGGRIEETEDGLVITGSDLTGGSVDSYNDHRIAMSAAVASAVCGDRVTISECRCVDKSYPAFYEDYERLGGTIHGIHMG